MRSRTDPFVTGLVLMIVVLFFCLKDGEKMWNFTLRWFRGERRANYQRLGAVRIHPGKLPCVQPMKPVPVSIVPPSY